jgi:Fic family protein
MLGIENIRITPEILARACAVDEFKGTWQGLEQFTTGLSVISEVAKYGAGFKRVFDPLKGQEITPTLIRTAHAPPKKGEPPIGYKTEDATLQIMQGKTLVGSLETAPPEQVGVFLSKLVNWMNGAMERKDMHPLIIIAAFTAVFLQIAPFENGNMRTVRFLILLLMLKAGYSYAPYVPLDKIMDKRANEIYEALKFTQESLEAGRPDWSIWLRCFLIILQDQANVLREKLGKKELETGQIPPLSAKVIQLFSEKDKIQMREIVRMTKGRRSTLKLRLNELVDQGYLRRHGNARSTWYSRV